MNMIPRLLSVLLVGSALAQDRVVDVPQLFRVGPVPAKAVAITMLADGSLHAADGSETTLEQAVPDVEAAVLVRADAATPVAAIAQLLAVAGKRGMHAVHFAARLPDNTAGAFCIAVSAAEPVARVEMKLHFDRPGVPANSVLPLLHRMVAGSGVPKDAPFVLVCKAPPAARWAVVLPVLAAAAEAGVACAALQAEEEAGGALLGLHSLAGNEDTGHRSPAIDLGPVPDIQVQAQTIEQAKPVLQATAFGFVTPPAKSASPAIISGAGGRYGGRAGGARAASESGQAIDLAMPWLLERQLLDGAFPSEGEQGSVEATSLVLLALLGKGNTLDAGPESGTVQRGVGWLLAAQRPDGSFVGNGNGAVHQQALACYALAEATGLSTSGVLLRGATIDALAWLAQQRANDGGFGAGGASPSNAGDTTLALTAFASAAFFKIDARLTAKDLVVWFDGKASAPVVDRAAELFARYFSGQNPGVAGLATQVLAGADIQDPWCAYWATYALFQGGGAQWVKWSKQLSTLTGLQSREGDDRGSWPPAAGMTRLETTALRTLTLQAGYRYARLIR